MNGTTVLRGHLLLPLLTGPAAAFDPVDDFERGFFTESAFVDEVHDIAIPASDGHAMHPIRTLILDSDGGLVYATNTSTTPFPDYALLAYAAGTGSVSMRWDWGSSRDLTAFGTIDRIEMLVGGSPPGGQITTTLTDLSGSESVTRPTSGGLELLAYPLGDWMVVDPTAARSLTVRFAGGEDHYTVSEIRFRRVGSVDVDLIGDFVATAVPPLPSPPLRYRVLDDLANPLYRADVVIRDAVAEGPVEMTASWREQLGVAGDQGVTEFQWNPAGEFQNTAFTFSIDFTSADGFAPEAWPPDPYLDDPTSFSLAFPVRALDGGATVGTSNTLLLFDIHPGQGLEFSSAAVTPRRSTGAWTTGFDVLFELGQVSGVELELPLLITTWIADWVPADAVGVGGSGTAPGPRLHLVARPSPTRGRTEIGSNRPFTAHTQLCIHDVAGRLVRALIPWSGAEHVVWDGRDRSGMPVPAGVYFVRLQEPSGEVAARVIQVR